MQSKERRRGRGRCNRKVGGKMRGSKRRRREGRRREEEEEGRRWGEGWVDKGILEEVEGEEKEEEVR